MISKELTVSVCVLDIIESVLDGFAPLILRTWDTARGVLLSDPV